MGKLIRRTLTITITESWTITWTPDEGVVADDAPQATTILLYPPTTQEEPDDVLQTALSDADPAPTPIAPAASNAAIVNRRKSTTRRANSKQRKE